MGAVCPPGPFNMSLLVLAAALVGVRLASSLALMWGGEVWLAGASFVLGFLAVMLSPPASTPLELRADLPAEVRDASAPTSGGVTTNGNIEQDHASDPQRLGNGTGSAKAIEAMYASVQEEQLDSLDVRELLQEHAHVLREMHELVCTHPHFKPERHDGLWLLRYWLSHRKVPQAVAAACSALQIRHELKLDEVAEFVRTRDLREWPHFDELAPLSGIIHMPVRPPNETEAEVRAWAAFDSKFEEKQEPAAALAAAETAFREAGGRDWLWFERGLIETGLLKDVRMHQLYPKKEKLNLLSRYIQEWVFQVLDEATRRRGKVVKLVRVLSVKGFSLRMLNMKLAQWDAQNKARCQDLYPQLLGQMYYVNPPKSMLWIWLNVIRPLMPQRVTSKTNVLDVENRQAHCDLVGRHCKREFLPHFIGGFSHKKWPLTDEPMPPIGLRPFIRYDIPAVHATHNGSSPAPAKLRKRTDR